MSSQFDAYKNSYQNKVEYSISFMHQGMDFFIKEKVNHIEKIIELEYGNDTSIQLLDFGCGSGYAHKFFKNKNIKISGVDLSEELIKKAKAENPQNVYSVYNGKDLPYKSESFDIIIAICVFHHIPHERHLETLLKLKKIVKRGGCIIIFEHNPFNPLTRLAVLRCEFDKNAVLIPLRNLCLLLKKIQFCSIEKKYILYFPFGFHYKGRIENFIQWLPLGAQYYVIGKKV